MIDLASGRPQIMGILNVTPDSFSDGGQFLEPEQALQQAQTMIIDGADIIDIGGESTRPGSQRVSVAEQIQRVLPVIEAIHGMYPDIPISIDTTRAEVAEAAMKAGAGIINDISAGRDDPGLLSVAAKKICPCILMHMKGAPETMQDNPDYVDVVSEVLNFLLGRAEAAMNAGIRKENIILDPGIGFGKNREHNLQLLANLEQLVATGYPVLLGASRKRFMGSLSGAEQPRDRVSATCATTALGVAAGVRIFRVHDVLENRQAADAAWHIQQYASPAG